MNIVDLPESLTHISTVGFNLSAEQRAAMRTSLRIVARDYRLKTMHLWGRVTAHQRDYYVAVGRTASPLSPASAPAAGEIASNSVGELSGESGTTLFVSQSLTRWAQLPEVSPADAARCASLTGPFTGDLGYEYTFRERVLPWEDAKARAERERRRAANSGDNSDDDNSDNSDNSDEDNSDNSDDNSDASGGNPGGNPLGGRFDPVVRRRARRKRYVVTEEVRLAACVREIARDTSVVPRGSHVIDQEDNVSANPGFEGLSAQDAGNLSFYQHLRRPQVLAKKSLRERYAANLVYDFLDRLDEDVPQGQWAVHRSATGDRVTVRSLLWPGYVAYHVPGTQKYGAIYQGTGQKASDLGFMI